jgi:hypothetical protein
MQGALIKRTHEKMVARKRYFFCYLYIINGVGLFQNILGDAIHDAFDLLNRCRGQVQFFECITFT